ncbi:G5 domain-containing protein [Brevibacillus humidisoli]|uniref:3D domain-containing protein n=1 Tax=Brevibacillus humidisoli TaxID=2895522 RepID=UPI001E43A0D2|nr:3D domain-containing protein [Brevibacillus humidisoli]UFJ40530.1 G5 domain-containing protein [Brevibacillus humidisoli]
MEIGKIWTAHKAVILSLTVGVALIASSMASYFFLILAAQPKQVTLNVDGVTQTFQTRADTVAQFLTERNITIRDIDVLTPDADTSISDSLVIQLQTSWEVPVLVGTEKKVVHTAKRDVAGVLQDAGIALGQSDRVEPSLTSKIEPDTQIVVTKVKENVVQVEQEVPFQEIRRNDGSLAKGEMRVLQKGEPGKAVMHYKVMLENGKEVSRELIKQEIIKPKSDRIVAVGTAQEKTNLAEAWTTTAMVSRGGVQFRPRSVLKGVTLTAYTPAGGGKSPSSPGYGYTAMGVKAVEGKTIAVDPKVIPLGWWVYIEGIGYRRAEDTGGAIKGSKIDVFFNNRSEALQFGRKRGKTVYIIGPQKP